MSPIQRLEDSLNEFSRADESIRRENVREGEYCYPFAVGRMQAAIANVRTHIIAVLEGLKERQYHQERICPHCHGAGYQRTGEVINCPNCDGVGALEDTDAQVPA